jgi:hypothetical protein
MSLVRWSKGFSQGKQVEKRVSPRLGPWPDSPPSIGLLLRSLLLQLFPGLRDTTRELEVGHLALFGLLLGGVRDVHLVGVGVAEAVHPS